MAFVCFVEGMQTIADHARRLVNLTALTLGIATHIAKHRIENSVDSKQIASKMRAPRNARNLFLESDMLALHNFETNLN